jgi:hypothetical protein
VAADTLSNLLSMIQKKQNGDLCSGVGNLTLHPLRGRCRRGRPLDQRDAVSLEQYPTDGLPRLRLHINLLRVVQSHVHVLIEPNDDSFNPSGRVLVQPYLNALFLQ